MTTTKHFATHVCLVSAQATPNLTPALDESFAPQRVVLVVSPDMAARAETLSGVLRRRGIVVERLDIADAYDYFAIEETLLNWLAENTTEDVALNVTGGTKVMAMAAQEVFRGDQKPVFYVNIADDSVLFIGAARQTRKLASRVKLRDYLETYGYTLPNKPERPPINANERDLVEKLVYDVAAIGGGLGQINWLAQSALKSGQASPRSEEMDARQLDSKQLDEVIERFSAAGFLTREGNRLVFADEAARSFVNGAWLELHVYRTLSDLKTTLNLADWATNLDVLAPNGSTKNELDAVFLCRNRLHLIECKSANLAQAGAGGSKGTDALYKLDTLQKIGGIATRAMLIDYRGSLSKADVDRARSSAIEVVSGGELRRLRERLIAWTSKS